MVGQDKASSESTLLKRKQSSRFARRDAIVLPEGAAFRAIEEAMMKTQIDNLMRSIWHNLAQPYPAFDISQEPYIAQMWAYAKSSVHHAQGVEEKLADIEANLRAARNCSDDWLADWSRMAALSLGQTRDLQAAVVSELEQLANAYRTLRSVF